MPTQTLKATIEASCQTQTLQATIEASCQTKTLQATIEASCQTQILQAKPLKHHAKHKLSKQKPLKHHAKHKLSKQPQFMKFEVFKPTTQNVIRFKTATVNDLFSWRNMYYIHQSKMHKHVCKTLFFCNSPIVCSEWRCTKHVYEPSSHSSMAWLSAANEDAQSMCANSLLRFSFFPLSLSAAM